MSSKRNQYKCLSIAQKKEILEAVANGEKKIKVANQFSISLSTLTSILKKKDSLLSTSSQSKRMRCREGGFPQLEHCLLEWFMQSRAQNVPISGPLLQDKAKSFAVKLGLNSFRASDGWLSNFKKRHNLVFKKICGESASVGQEICLQWKEKLLSLISPYDARNVFNADETGLFYECLPDRTLCLKNEKCHGGKNSKVRVTLLLCANMDGSQKLKLLMIGKSAKPRCFKNIRSFPVEYRANKKAWMTALLFSEWLLSLNQAMKEEKRKILLFIDNCAAHNEIPELSNVKVEFLPPNTTSKLQPLDQGIIKNFKVYYRAEVVSRLLNNLEEGKDYRINILDAMNIADRAWNNVSCSTIRNCFATCGFYENIQVQSNICDAIIPTTDEWNRACGDSENVSFDDFIHLDDDVAVIGMLTEDEIINNNIQSDESDNDDNTVNNENVVMKRLTYKQAKDNIDTLRYYLTTTEISSDIFLALNTLENAIDNAKIIYKQKKITEFFQKN